jgi:hypothetical protein
MKTFILLALTTLSLQSFAQTTSRELDSIRELGRAAKTLAQTDLRCSVDADCAVLELGSKACGGVQDFLLVSKKHRSLKEILYLAQRTVERESAYNVANSVISDCGIDIARAPSCLRNKCSLN